jgi:ribonuclease VapC
MNKIVLDASVILAILNQEAGASKITEELLSSAVCSTVNLAEVQNKLVRDGIDSDEAWNAISALLQATEPFTAEQAKLAGSLVAETRSLGFSLGDRACLALGLAVNAPVYTADKSWSKVKLGIPIHVIR